MSGSPPLDDELEAALAQVEQTLIDQGVADPELRRVLLDQVRSALENAADWGELSFSVKVSGPTGEGEDEDEDPAAPARPTVSVVDGGRKRDEPRVSRGRPDLRVADEEGEDEAADSATTSGGSGATIIRTVRVGPQNARSVGQGWIEVGSHGQQGIYLGQHPRCYRVLCLRGSLTVRVDGEHRQVLLAGQSVDVEGSNVTVLAEDGGPAQGAYTAV